VLAVGVALGIMSGSVGSYGYQCSNDTVATSMSGLLKGFGLFGGCGIYGIYTRGYALWVINCYIYREFAL